MPLAQGSTCRQSSFGRRRQSEAILVWLPNFLAIQSGRMELGQFGWTPLSHDALALEDWD